MQYIFETVLAKPVCRDLIRKVVCGFHSLLDTEITDSAVRGIFSLQCVSARLSVRLSVCVCVCGQRGDSISRPRPFHKTCCYFNVELVVTETAAEFVTYTILRTQLLCA